MIRAMLTNSWQPSHVSIDHSIKVGSTFKNVMNAEGYGFKAATNKDATTIQVIPLSGDAETQQPARKFETQRNG
jgi:hypothetical protein